MCVLTWRICVCRAHSARFRGQRCIDGSVAAPRDVVDTRKRGRAAAAVNALDAAAGAALLPAAPTLLVDHNADPELARRRTTGDWVVRACVRRGNGC